MKDNSFKIVGPHCTLKGITDEIKIVYLDGKPDLILESESYLVVDRLIENELEVIR